MTRHHSRDVIAAVAARFNLTVADLYGRRRDAHAATARNLAFLLLRRFCPHLSHAQIGAVFDGRDHSTVCHGVRAARAKLRWHPALKRDYQALFARLTRDDAYALDLAIAETNETLDALWSRRLALLAAPITPFDSARI